MVLCLLVMCWGLCQSKDKRYAGMCVLIRGEGMYGKV